MAYHGDAPTAFNGKRKPGKITNVVVDLLDDGTYTLCGYDENHMEARKESASGTKDVMTKFMGMMGKKVKDKIDNANA